MLDSIERGGYHPLAVRLATLIATEIKVNGTTLLEYLGGREFPEVKPRSHMSRERNENERIKRF